MNDRHPDGNSFPADPGADYSYAAYDAASDEQSAYGSYGTTDYATVSGNAGWSTGAYDVSTDAAYHGGYETGAYQAGAYQAGTYATGTYETGVYETGAYDATGFGVGGHDGHAYGTDTYAPDTYGTDEYGSDVYGTGGYEAVDWDGHGAAEHQSSGLIPQQPGPHVAEQDWPVPADGTGQWDAHTFDATGWDGAAAHGHGYGTAGYEPQAFETGVFATDSFATGSVTTGTFATGSFETGSFETAAWTEGYDTPVTADDAPAFDQQPTAAYEAYESHDGTDAESGDSFAADAHDEPVFTFASEAEPEPRAAASGPQGRGRRRSPKPHRSALLTVAAPSVAVLGVAGIAAASVLPAGEEETAQAAPDTTEVKVSPVNNKLDTQLAGLREAGDDFADRATRTQERIDLRKRQEAERRREAAEAARREALRPKFVLPVQGAGISAYFGQAGINWMSVHSGLDFPVSYGTPVKAATDGVVRSQWNPAYGNMLIVTAADGTETWYCHLSSTRIGYGSVKAGTVIGYSGNSGNSTGPHLHFEVRPGGGSAIDPLAWFRSHGLEPS